jgi:putative hydrolase of the HAD superfamily
LISRDRTETALKPKLITFDCAQTLLASSWSLDGFARTCTQEIGLDLPDEAYSRLLQLFHGSLPEFVAVNMKRDPQLGEAFWRELTRRWLGEFGIAESWVGPTREAANRLIYGPHSVVFKPFDDAAACLQTLADQGYRLAVVSNWDYSLHEVLRGFRLYDRFELVLASLEEGVEKPDPRLFQICLRRLGVNAGETVHVGDDLVDDVQGAIAAGIRPVHLARDGVASSAETTIGSLSELPEVLRSIF